VIYIAPVGQLVAVTGSVNCLCIRAQAEPALFDLSAGPEASPPPRGAEGDRGADRKPQGPHGGEFRST